MNELTERQARAALSAIKEFKTARELEPRRYSGSSYVYGLSVHVELIALDIWVVRIQMPGAVFRAGADGPQAALTAAIAILEHRLGLDQPKKRGPAPGPRPIKDGSACWADDELACMRIGAEAMLDDVSIKEAEQRVGDVRVRITTLPGDPWTAIAKALGHRAATLVATGVTREEALRRLAIRN